MRLSLFLLCLFTITQNSLALEASEFNFISNRNDIIAKEILAEIKNDLSSKFKESLPQNIKIDFKDLNGQSLTTINCKSHAVLGRMNAESIEVDKVFLKELQKGERSLFNCVHKDVKSYLKATIVHELAHLYDNKRKISKDPTFLNISGWVNKGILVHRRKNLNQNEDRSPDHFEFKNAQETFAVNLEHFLYDEDYKCRKPTYYEFYSKKLNLYPHERSSCEATKKVIAYNTDNTRALREIDLSQLYEVHYLLAGKGEQAISKFGHAMFRLVMCAPDSEKGPACLKDIKDHIVLSFRADVSNGSLDILKALNGQYTSELLVLPFSSVVEEYTIGGFRELSSLKIKFDEDQIERFLNRAKELVWGYSGKYYFITNNCASEAINLIKVATGNIYNVQTVNIKTPQGVYNYLVKAKMSEDSIFSDKAEAHKLGYYYPAAGGEIASSLKSLNINEKDINSFIRNYSTDQRRTLYLEKINLSKDTRKTAGDALKIESFILKHKNIQLQSRLEKAAHDQHGTNFATLTVSNKEITNSYGIPLEEEMNQGHGDNIFEDNHERSARVQAIEKKLFSKELKVINEVTEIQKTLLHYYK